MTVDINPSKLKGTFLYDASDSELEWWVLFCVSVAGKNADQTKKALGVFFENWSWLSPFEAVRTMNELGDLEHWMREARLGQYTRLGKAFTFLSKHFDAQMLRWVSVEELEAVPGIGPKTARFFLMTTRKDVHHAALDTHILKWLRSRGVHAPKQTPQNGEQYRMLENIFLSLCEQEGRNPTEMDYEIWQSYRKGDKD